MLLAILTGERQLWEHTVTSDMEKASSELVTIPYSLRGIKSRKFKQTQGCILMQGKTNSQQALGETGQKSKQVQNGLHRWKENRSTSDYKTPRKTQPRTQRNRIARSWEETLKHRLTSPASYTHKHS